MTMTDGVWALSLSLAEEDTREADIVLGCQVYTDALAAMLQATAAAAAGCPGAPRL